MRYFLFARLTRCLAVTGLVTFAAGLSAQLVQTKQTLDFESALRIAAEQAPSLKARAATAQGARALQTSAAELPDPKLSVGIDSLPINGPDRGSLVRDNFTQRQIGWSQDVPNRARRAARSDAALARTEREQALLQMDKLTVRRETGLAWLQRFFADKRLSLFDELIAQQRMLIDTAPGQLAAGKIAPADVTLLKIEAATLADRRDELQREAHHAHAALRRWLGDSEANNLTALPPLITLDRAYLQTNLQRNPEIAALQPLRTMAEADLREADAMKSGDWNWSVRYGKRGQAYSDFLSVMLTFDLPLSPNTRQQPLVSARQKELERIENEREDLLRRQTQDLETLLNELDEASSKLDRLTLQTAQLAAERSALTLAAYQSGRDKLAAVLEARKLQLEIGLRALELQGKKLALQWRLNSIIAE